MEKSYYKSPVGNLEIVCQNDELVLLRLIAEQKNSDAESEFMREIKTQLEAYFSGKIQKFDIKVNPQGTEFQKFVWNELCNIPYGKTESYSEIAARLGCKNASRAVGGACNKNPIMIIIPCHRVVSKNGSLGGFAYGCCIKQSLLELEQSNNGENISHFSENFQKNVNSKKFFL